MDEGMGCEGKGIKCRVGKYGKEKQNSRSNFSLCSLLIFRCSVIGSEHSWRMGEKKKYGVFCRKKSSMAEGKNNILYAEKMGTDCGGGGGNWSAGLLDQMGTDCFRASSIS
jgi:hypothetical protein